MRTDVPKFADKRVRQAIAMTLDRPAIITGLFRGLAEPGNDSPFAPVYPSTDHGVPQRKKDIPAARALMAAAGRAERVRGDADDGANAGNPGLCSADPERLR